VLTASAEELEARGYAAFSAPGSSEQETLVYQVGAAYSVTRVKLPPQGIGICSDSMCCQWSWRLADVVADAAT